MKLYFAPNACSLAPHIILRELGLPFELVRVNNQSKRCADGRDFRSINPKGYVAALLLDNGEVLTEGPAILQYLADLRPEAGLAPANGSWERSRLQELLNFISAEIHAGSAPLFNAELPEAARVIFGDKLFKRLGYLNELLGSNDYLQGAFSIADAYLFTVLGWLPVFAIDIAQWPALAGYVERVAARPAVQAAVHAEHASAPV
ncbi:glutathione transferase GstA [Pseudomonas sp. BIGb0427]|uniref:glutathione transferase GstA n=1 Tax=unclassified Pseudomonas TaxID=196821 RepID=UPI0018A73ACE|nr:MULTISPECIES: glutathione transferase GstA [unclassified Pseudomonas]QPG61437.1 glutathione transferase GstA [Pseudomonas sp. BIGb0427]QVM94744.1 glutathione transferase GstA [Pseudomonas sp. SORT22]UVM68953.1 glutathione transferase GstA [Pseudomonas sp. B21-009]